MSVSDLDYLPEHSLDENSLHELLGENDFHDIENEDVQHEFGDDDANNAPIQLPYPLTQDHLKLCLCDLSETIEGLSFSQRKVICNAQSITNIGILETYIHLQDVNIAFNLISDITPLHKLTLIHTLDCSYNRIKAIPDCTWPFLAKLNLNNNLIINLPEMIQPHLQVLMLNNNLILSLVNDDGEYLLKDNKLPRLHTIELRGNRLTTSEPLILDSPLEENTIIGYTKYLKKIGLCHSGLKMIIMAENNIKTMASFYEVPTDISEDKSVTLKLNPFGSRMGIVPNLVILHLRKNGLKSLQGFTAECFHSLEYLNLRQNEIEDIEQLNHLSLFPKLSHIILSGNPIDQLENYRIEVLVCLKQLQKLDKEMFTLEDIEEANAIDDERKLTEFEQQKE